MSKMTIRSVIGLTVAALVVVSGCGGGASSGANDQATTGFLSLGISDGPIHSAKKVCITFDSVEIHGDGNTELIALDPAEKVNLLAVQGANAAPILLNYEIPAGNYQWLRLGVDAERGGMGGADDSGDELICDGAGSYIVMDDETVYNLFVPSGAQNGLKLVSGVTVPANGFSNVTAEFDLARSITNPPGLEPDVILKPVIRLVDNTEVGTLTGVVATELATAEACEPSVCLFDDGVTPNPIDDGEVADPEDPVATAMVHEHFNDDGSVTWNYEIGYLLAGDYEAAFTCDGELFEPTDGQPAQIITNEVTVVGFEAPAM